MNDTKNIEQLEAEIEEQRAEANRWAFKHGEALAEISQLEKENHNYRRAALFLLAFFAGALWASILFDMIEA